MTVFDAFMRLLGGSGSSTLPIELSAGEQERGRFAASRLTGGLSLVGGDLVVTDRRVIFTPLNVTDIVQVLGWGLSKAGGMKAVTQAPIKLGELAGQPTDAGLLTTAEAGQSATLTRPPEILLADTKGNKTAFGVLASRTKRNADPANTVARDELIALVNGLL